MPERRDEERRGGAASVIRALAFLVALACSPLGAQDDLLLPDIFVRRADLFDNELDIETLPGRTLLRFRNGTGNTGLGKLYLEGQTPNFIAGTQEVVQRIFREDGSFEERPAGVFVHHEGHNHIHLEDWALYRLREVLPGDGVGDVIAESAKTSFCILDLEVFNSRLPNFVPIGQFRSCEGLIQGLSVGWIDVYEKDLEGQFIDITGLPDGMYWLESTVDPVDHILESNEDNNVARVKVTIGDPHNAPDRYEPNDSLEDLADRPAGRPFSPNLGPCNPKRVIEDLNLLLGSDDYFSFYANDTGGPGDFVRIDFAHADGDLDLALLDAGGKEVARSAGTENREVIPLEGRPEGWYHVLVTGKDGATNTSYRLVVNPPQNRSPEITVFTPPPGETRKLHGGDSYAIRWAVDDPENDDLWVSVFLNDQPVLDGTMIPVSTAQFLDGHLGVGVINSSELQPGTYWVFCVVTDGGVNRGAWAQGSVTFVAFDGDCRVDSPERDCNGNTIDDACEIESLVGEDCNENGVLDACEIASDPSIDRNGNAALDVCEVRFHRGDPNVDGELNVADPLFLLNFLFTGGPSPECLESADGDNDGEIVISDAVMLLQFLFSGGAPPADPGPPGAPCGPGPDSLDSDEFLGCAGYDRCE